MIVTYLTIRARPVSYSDLYEKQSVMFTISLYVNQAVVPIVLGGYFQNYFGQGGLYNMILVLALTQAFCTPALNLINISGMLA